MEEKLDPSQVESTLSNGTNPVQTEIPERKDLVLTYISINFLKEVAKWTKFISIVGFVLVGFMVLAGLAFGSIMATMTSMIPEE